MFASYKQNLNHNVLPYLVYVFIIFEFSVVYIILKRFRIYVSLFLIQTAFS